MKPKGTRLPLLCVLLTWLSLPAVAQADFDVTSGASAEAHLAGTHGYRLTISAQEGHLSVAATKGNAWVSYFTRAKFEDDRIDARLPGVGRVSLRFHERERGHEPGPAYCHGPAPVVRRGVFVGWIRIRGERDYTRAESRHVRGKIVGAFRTKCHLPFRAQTGIDAPTRLEAAARRGKGLLTFSAIRLPLGDQGEPVVFRASLDRQRGPMLVSNTVWSITKKGDSLAIASPPRSATIDPPRPFTGGAAFQQESSKDFSWTGDLAAELPGIGEVSLAGPGFKSSLCLGRRCRGDLDESGTSTVIAVAQGSGSHSQPLALARLSSLR
jgi:hypothetical protein